MRPLLVACLLALTAPSVNAQSARLDPAALAARTDTFAFRVNGRDAGLQVTTLRKEPDGFLFRESTTTPAGRQTTEVRLDPGLRVESVQQEGEMGGDALRIDVEYEGGRARGEARVPGAAGMTDVAVEAAVPPDVIDDNVLMSLLPALPWTPDAAFDLPVFSAGTNSLTVYTFSVTATEPVTVPAGTFEALRVEVTGGAQPLVLHIAAAAPHRLLRLRVAGAPMELVLTGPAAP